MTELLRKAVVTLSELPPEKQDALAAMVLEEIAFERVSSHPPLSIDALEEEACNVFAVSGDQQPRGRIGATSLKWLAQTGYAATST
jgi:hypothetical protein